MSSLTDREVVNVLLDGQKLSATSYTNLILESSNQYLRDDVSKILDRTFNYQKRIFDFMTQKGWYNTQNATQQDITKAQQQVSGDQTVSM